MLALFVFKGVDFEISHASSGLWNFHFHSLGLNLRHILIMWLVQNIQLHFTLKNHHFGSCFTDTNLFFRISATSNLYRSLCRGAVNTHTHMHTYNYRHTHTHTATHTHTHTHTYRHTHTHTHTITDTHTLTDTRTHTLTDTRTHTHLPTHTHTSQHVRKTFFQITVCEEN